MDKLKFLFIILFSFFTLAANAQDKEKVIEYNLGVVPPDKVIIKNYEIPGELDSAVSLCECLQAKIEQKGKNSSVEVEFDPSEYKGLTIQEVKLSDKLGNITTLRLRMYVQKPKPQKKSVPPVSEQTKQ